MSQTTFPEHELYELSASESFLHFRSRMSQWADLQICNVQLVTIVVLQLTSQYFLAVREGAIELPR